MIKIFVITGLLATKTEYLSFTAPQAFEDSKECEVIAQILNNESLKMGIRSTLTCKPVDIIKKRDS